VGFNLEDVILNTNNEVALLFLEHSNKEVFLCVSDLISKCCIRKAFTRSLVQYKEYLSEFWYSANALDNSKVSLSIPTGGIYEVLGLNTFRKAIGAHYLSHSSDYVDPPSIDIALKPNQPEEPPFTAHMMAICNAEKPMAFKAPRTSSHTKKKVSQGTKPGARAGHKKQSSSKQPTISSSEATKDTGMHKEDQQAVGGLTSLGVTSEEGAHPQLSSGMSVFSNLKPIYSTSIIIHSESASGYDASTNSIAEADLGTSASNDSLPLQQGKDEGIKNHSLDHIFAGIDSNVLANKTKSISDGLETVLTTPKTGTSNVAKPSEEIKFGEIKLEDLAKLVPNVKADFKDLDSLEDDLIIVVDESEGVEEEDKNEEIHSTTNDETKDNSASTPLSPKTKKTKSEAKIARLKAQSPSPNVGQLNELLVKSLTAEFLRILFAYDFHSSLSTELKELPSKFNELTDEVKVFKTHVHGLEIEVPRDLKELPTNLEEFTTTVASAQAKLKTLDALPSLLLKVTQALNMFVKVLHSATSKAGDQRVPSAGQDGTMPAEGEKNTNQATISQLFQRRAKKNTERKNLNKPQPKTTSPPNPPIITTTAHMQSPFLSNLPKSSF
ncbi:hypothetical protein Tco_0738743, partial [Tanacetum coccineum]